MEERQISKAVIKRLPRYYRYLGEMLNNGVERISSGELSTKMQVTASQIRQDLNNFGGFGQQGYGYNVKFLYDEIGKILGVDKKHPMIIIGGGNFGHALANYDFEKNGFITKAIFDVLGNINEVFQGKYGFIHHFWEYMVPFYQLMKYELEKIEKGDFTTYPFLGKVERKEIPNSQQF